MKKNIPNLLTINIEFDPIHSENILLWRYNQAIKKGYCIPFHDSYCYFALLIKRNEVPDKIMDYVFKDGALKVEVRFELVKYKILNNEEINEEDLNFYYSEKRKIVNERKEIIKKEIARTNIKGKLLNTINHNNSEYYRLLLILVREFTDVTILDWFVPIVLKFDRLVHIFIKHVEETKFADGQFKNRTYFSYSHNEIWLLIKSVIIQEEDDLKDHFIENAVFRDEGKKEKMKDYNRNYKNPIFFNKDKFLLTIDKNGFIMKFHQIE